MRRVLCWSAGMDSFLSDYFLKLNGVEFSKVYFNINSRYSEHELNFLHLIYADDGICSVDISNHIDMGCFEHEDAFIPNRNGMMAMMAQSLFDADEILFSCAKDDRCYDQSVEFFSSLSKTISLSVGKEVVVRSALAEREKSEWVKEYATLNKNEKENLATFTYSCYSPDWNMDEVDVYEYNDQTENFTESAYKLIVSGCMNCQACYRKMSSLSAANIYIPIKDKVKALDYPKTIDNKRYPNRWYYANKYAEFINFYKG
jgi:7-cyano-7-deazaguanine synthase in queuosine biosynthesis